MILRDCLSGDRMCPPVGPGVPGPSGTRVFRDVLDFFPQGAPKGSQGTLIIPELPKMGIQFLEAFSELKSLWLSRFAHRLKPFRKIHYIPGSTEMPGPVRKFLEESPYNEPTPNISLSGQASG